LLAINPETYLINFLYEITYDTALILPAQLFYRIPLKFNLQQKKCYIGTTN